MDIKFSKEDIAAIETKAMNPNEVILCPRCGNELSYREVGNSYEVKCSTNGCIKATCRGL